MIQPRAEAGDVIIFTGVMQHCAMPNKSKASRTAILIQMLPKVMLLIYQLVVFFNLPFYVTIDHGSIFI